MRGSGRSRCSSGAAKRHFIGNSVRKPVRVATQGGAVYSTASYTTNRLDQYTDVTGLPVSYDLNGNLTHLERAGMALDADYIYSAQNQLLTNKRGHVINGDTRN